MNLPDQSNHHFQMAVKFVNQTSRHLFLTGKAGTGKTTFLRYIQQNSPKKLAVVAPTGVAAINAGGVTIHSFFQLPLGSFLPDKENMPEGNFYNRSGLLKNLRINGEKRKLIQELDLLIIDEVSMVRADLVDAIDLVLKYVRRQHNLPFGGVQVLFIGDLFQLPPVVNDLEWKTLKNHYESPLFFYAHALKQSPPLYLELKKIYRQKDEVFIRLLNNLRTSSISEQDISLLNTYYHPDFKPQKAGEYIILTTHNYKADQINKKELEKISGSQHLFEAKIEGEFNERSAPADIMLQLKENAQVMFIRNDKGEGRRFYNGKIATISRIEKEKIFVTFPGENDELKVEKETWKNVRYKYNSEADYIEEEEIGKFTQFPLRLAWAITIHKSQGLTFDRAIIDAGDSFAPGQVYVALSRLTSLEGLILYSRIRSDAVSTDKEAMNFSSSECDSNTMVKLLGESQKQFIHDLLIQIFTWTKITESLEVFIKELENRAIPNLNEAKNAMNDMMQKAALQQKTAEKFLVQLDQLLSVQSNIEYQTVHNRVSSASKYFSEALYNELSIPLKDHFDKTKNLSKVKKYLKDLQRLSDSIHHKEEKLALATQITAGLMEGTDADKLLQDIAADKKNNQEKHIQSDEKQTSKPKIAKGDSHRLSLMLFKGGKSIEEIASERDLVKGTIESHLIFFIATGEIDIKDLVKEETLHKISEAMAALGDVSSAVIKENLGDSVTYGEIRAVLNYHKKTIDL